MNLYDILNIKKNASNKDIKKAFKEKAKTTHPDRGGKKGEFEKVKEAYMVLHDPSKRQKYDETGQYEDNPPNIMGQVSSLFFTVVDGVGDNIDRVDIIEEMLKILNKAINNVTRDEMNVIKKITRTEKLIGRITSDTPRTIFDDIIEGRIRELKGQRQNLEDANSGMMQVKGIIEVHKCECEITDLDPREFRGATNYNSFI